MNRYICLNILGLIISPSCMWIAVMVLGNKRSSDNAYARALSDFLLGTLSSPSYPCDGISCSPTLLFAMYAGSCVCAT